MPRRQHQFTIYDAMDARGDFDRNPANAGAYDRVSGEVIYSGPVQFPKMLYHPDGETYVTKPAEEINTPFGPKRVGEQREIISRIVATPDEEKVWKAKGWHNHPRGAVIAAGGDAPPPSYEEQIADLKAELEKMRASAVATASMRHEVEELVEAPPPPPQQRRGLGIGKAPTMPAAADDTTQPG